MYLMIVYSELRAGLIKCLLIQKMLELPHFLPIPLGYVAAHICVSKSFFLRGS
jgi:hypothetical protein